MGACHNCRCFVIPPHMLMEISKNGSPQQKIWAAHTLRATAKLLGDRGQHNFMAQHHPAALQAAVGGKNRIVYHARNQERAPGDPVRSEGGAPSGDPAIDEAYDGAGHTYDLFAQVFGRNSIDGNGMRLDSTVHYGKAFDNAFWDGRQMVYGDGDGQLFNRFTAAMDVIGHELTHGVVQHTANLAYWEQSGALNESFADVFGSLVRQHAAKQEVGQADWLIGGGLLTPNVKGSALRSMRDPGTAYNDPVLGKDPQPKHMREYKDVNYDEGGVHINSGIPNHAFYLAAMDIGGYAWEKTGKIWYETLKRLGRNTRFQQAAQVCIQVAAQLYGDGSREHQAVRKAWAAVGLA